MFGAVVRRLADGRLFVRTSRFLGRGLETGDAFDELYRQFDRIGGTHLVVFDEIDHLEDANTLLDELPHARDRTITLEYRRGTNRRAVVAALLRNLTADAEEVETRLLGNLKRVGP